MAVSILDYVKSKVGEKETYSMGDFMDNNVPMLAGCEVCSASLGPYNSFPAHGGYIRCGDHVGDQGFVSVQDFEDWLSDGN
ncbi:hypothetical protein AB0E01_22940 [Nocardia vinacea]|uniref:hypothetical protein n=1 Tax=Nocardia vinacea TaxID=96468 RepID=UPI0033EAEE06